MNTPGPVWTDWRDIGPCSVTCESGTQSLKRTCSVPGKCVGDATKTRKSVDGDPSHIPALIKANRIEASYFLPYVAKYG